MTRLNKCLLTDSEMFSFLGAIEGITGIEFPDDMSPEVYLKLYRLIDAFKYGTEEYDTVNIKENAE